MCSITPTHPSPHTPPPHAPPSHTHLHILTYTISDAHDDSEIKKVTKSNFSRNMFCAGRVVEEDLKRTMKACGGSIQTSANNLTPDVLGTCELFEEIQVGGER